MADDFEWLDKATIIEINKYVISLSEDKAEQHHLIDENRLDGALTRPANLHYYDGTDDLLELAVSYMMSIAQAHAFEQGNKRTGFYAGRRFLNMHGFDITVGFDREPYGNLFIKVMNGDAKESTLVEALAYHIVDDEWAAMLDRMAESEK